VKLNLQFRDLPLEVAAGFVSFVSPRTVPVPPSAVYQGEITPETVSQILTSNVSHFGWPSFYQNIRAIGKILKFLSQTCCPSTPSLVQRAVPPRPVWQRVSTDSLKFHLSQLCPTLLLAAGGRPAAVFFTLGYPMPYRLGASLQGSFVSTIFSSETRPNFQFRLDGLQAGPYGVGYPRG
jgi:hypothetical protein